MPKIVFADSFNITSGALSDILALGTLVRCDLSDRAGLLKAVRDAQVVVAEYALIDKELMDAAPSLKGIVVYGVGMNHVDIKEAARRGIALCNTAGANAEAVAELTFGLLLNCLRRAHEADTFIRSGRWQGGESGTLPAHFHGTELKGKSMGIIGYGNIGRRVGEIARAFGMKTFHWQPRPSDKSEAENCPYRDLENLLSSVDVLSVNCPLNEKSQGLLSRERLLSMKRGAVLVVTSRGKIVDEGALAELLAAGHIASAGLDVFADEPLRADSPLRMALNAVLTPHIGGSTVEAEANIAAMIAAACRAMLENATNFSNHR